MSTALQLRRGTTAQHSSFTGLLSEVTVDTSKKTAVVHDGTTAGGIPMLREDVNNLHNNSIDVVKVKATGSPDASTYLRGDGKWAVPSISIFPAGTLMLFQQSTAPTGWTKQTVHNDKALRVVSGTASSGGSTPFSSVFVNQTTTVSLGGVSINSTTLTTSQMPPHTHGVGKAGGINYYSIAGTVASEIAYATDQAYEASYPYLQSSGGGGSHTHSLSGTATTSALSLSVQYVDLIIASKN